MSKKDKILGTDEAWELETLGADEKHAVPTDSDSVKLIDESLSLQMISIRLDKGLIESFKTIGSFHGIGYQPLMRDALKRFAECEMKAIVSGLVQSQRQEQTSRHLSNVQTKTGVSDKEDHYIEKKAA